jgi:hypothetical protein
VKKSQLSDKQLEEILGQMPKIRDNRDPRDIYQNIAHRIEKRRMPVWAIPSAALAAVLFLAFVLTPGLMNSNQSAEKSMDSSTAEESKPALDMDTAKTEKAADKSADQQAANTENNKMMQDTGEQEEQGQDFKMLKSDNLYGELTALYEEELAGQETEVLTYSIPDQNVQVLVPVSTVIPKDEGRQWIESFTDTMPKLKEEAWGLSEFYPIDAAWQYDEATKTLNMDVKEEHPYKYGSVSNTMLLEAMSQNLSGKGIEKLTFSTEQNPGIDMGNYGVLTEEEIVSPDNKNRAYMFYASEGLDKLFLVPTKEQFADFITAFGKMRENMVELGLTASLPDDFKPSTIAFDEDQSQITIVMDNGKLNEEFLPNLEAILLTAKDFGYQTVKIENAGSEQLGPFNMNEPIPVPVAPNKKSID